MTQWLWRQKFRSKDGLNVWAHLLKITLSLVLKLILVWTKLSVFEPENGSVVELTLLHLSDMMSASSTSSGIIMAAKLPLGEFSEVLCPNINDTRTWKTLEYALCLVACYLQFKGLIWWDEVFFGIVRIVSVKVEFSVGGIGGQKKKKFLIKLFHMCFKQLSSILVLLPYQQ